MNKFSEQVRTAQSSNLIPLLAIVFATISITYWDLSQYFQVPEEPGVLNYSYLFDPLISGTFQNLQVAADPSSLAAIPWSVVSLVLDFIGLPAGTSFIVMQIVLRVSLALSLYLFFNTFLGVSKVLSVCGPFVFLSSLTGYYTSLYTTRTSSIIILSLVLSTFISTHASRQRIQRFIFTRMLLIVLLLPGLLSNLGHFLSTASVLGLVFWTYRKGFIFPKSAIRGVRTIVLVLFSTINLFLVAKTYLVHSIFSSFGQYKEFVLTFSSGSFFHVIQGRGAWWETEYLRWDAGFNKLTVQGVRFAIFIIPAVYLVIRLVNCFRFRIFPSKSSIYINLRISICLILIGFYEIDRTVFNSSSKFWSVTNWIELLSSNAWEISLMTLFCTFIFALFVYISLSKRTVLYRSIVCQSDPIPLMFLSSLLVYLVWATPTDKMVGLSPYLGMFRETWTKFGGFMYLFIVSSFLSVMGHLYLSKPRLQQSIRFVALSITLLVALVPLYGKSSYRLSSDAKILDVNNISIVNQIGRTAKNANEIFAVRDKVGFCLIPRYSRNSSAAVGIVRVLGPLLVNEPVFSQVTGEYGVELLQMGLTSDNCASDPQLIGICIYDRIDIESVNVPTWCESSFPLKDRLL